MTKLVYFWLPPTVARRDSSTTCLLMPKWARPELTSKVMKAAACRQSPSPAAGPPARQRSSLTGPS